MSKNKLRVLSVGESTFLATGFAVYHKEVNTRLHQSGKYHLAELGIHGRERESRATMPWTYYGNVPNTADQSFHSNQMLSFGLHRFNHVALDFKPHAVLDARDPWMWAFIPESPYRPLFKFGLMPTYDSKPSDIDWIPAYIDADGLLTYSTWAIDEIDKQCGGKEKMIGCAAPAYDKKHYKPVPNKEAHKAAFNLQPNVNIVGFISRNQRRKLFPDLFAGFRLLLNRYKEEGKESVASKTFLYCHTSYPDVGWKLDFLLLEYGLANKVLFTYVCHSCQHFFPCFFQGATTVCKKCNRPTATMPSTEVHVSPENLASIYNLFDVYVQYAICEGAGMATAEAAACGVPVMAVDYSAMQSNMDELKGTPIEVQRMFFECETHAYRALPSNEDLADKLYKFFTLPSSVRLKKGHDAQKFCRKNFDYDLAAKQWMKFLDNIDPDEMEPRWKSPPRINQPRQDLCSHMSNSEFVEWAMINTLGDPNRINSHFALRLLSDLNNGCKQYGRGGIFHNEMSLAGQQASGRQLMTRQHILEELTLLARYRNEWESYRVGRDQCPETDSVRYARNRNKNV